MIGGDMDSPGPLFRIAWPLLASIAGAITALSFRPFQKMNRMEIGFALVVGASFATFVGPWAGHLVFGDRPEDTRLIGGLYYLMATGSNIIIPPLIRKLSRILGVEAGGEE